eukprot:m.221555 g.221555  ORF g.221555 m.221555 type:complete len:351 (-) comp10609_c0_seq1:325-1377(-)
MQRTSAVRVATYNVLSSALCSPGDFLACTPENLAPENRLPRVQAKLLGEMQQNAVICLQEVSRSWCGPLHVFFAAHNYQFASSLYGAPFNDYMGVAVAWPATFALEQLDIARVSATRPEPVAPRPEPPPVRTLWARLLAALRILLWGQPPILPTPADPWYLARNRYNTMIFAAVRSPDNATLCIGNYHMPCMFDQPKVMTIHAALFAMHVQRLAGPRPHVLIGDFNSLPDSDVYSMLTTGRLDPASPAHPVIPPWDPWRISLRAMRSAYVLATGKEPPFTNHSQFRANPPFVGTLDYIFCSDGIGATAVLPTPAAEGFAGPLPTADEPSDHLMLAATLEVPVAEDGAKST